MKHNIVVCVAALILSMAPVHGMPLSEAVILTNIPHVAQLPDFCGEACVEMVMRAHTNRLDQNDVFNLSGADPSLGRGCVTVELRDAMTAAGLKPGDTWHTIKAGDTNAISALWRAMLADLTSGVPSIVCMRTGPDKGASEHFRLLVGYDPSTDEAVYHEPADKKGAFRRMPRNRLLELWPLKYQADQWTVIRLRCESGKLISVTKPTGSSNADYAQHIHELKARISLRGFAIVVQPPFVVIGDEPAAHVRLRARQTVGWAVTALKKDYFAKDPAKILNVWLFKDKDSYEKNCRDMLGENPSTPFGFCSADTGDLIMNIATGGGTLVHEIVHPFMHANFPDCPAWFNEGMGSLYEQSAERDDRIVGLTNWRLDGLQKAIKAGTVPSFKDLTSTSSHEFYSKDRGTNYAQARYLCYHLQEKGLLVKFYKAFVANQKEDPSGYQTLITVLGEKDMAAFQKKWEKFVLALAFP